MFAADSAPPAIVVALVALQLLFGGWLLVEFARRLLRIWSTRKWVETECEVVSIRAVGFEDFSVEVSFTFQVGATTYQSNRFSLTDNLSVVDAHQYVERHPPNSKTVCYVNPADPSDAVFVRSVNITPVVLLLGLGAALLTCGVYGVFLLASGQLVLN